MFKSIFCNVVKIILWGAIVFSASSLVTIREYQDYDISTAIVGYMTCFTIIYLSFSSLAEMTEERDFYKSIEGNNFQ